MRGDGPGWRGLPPLMCVAIAAGVLRSALMVGFDLAKVDLGASWMELTDLGTSVASNALLAYAAFELASRSGPGVRIGWRIAGYAWGAAAALTLIWFAWVTLQDGISLSDHHRAERWLSALRYVWRAVDTAPFAGLAFAAWRRQRRGAATGGAVLAVAMLTQGWWRSQLFGGLGLDYHHFEGFAGVLELIGLALTVVLALAATSPTEDSRQEPDRAARGFRRAARGMRLRVLALMVGALGAVAMTHRSSDEAVIILKVALVGAAAFHAGGIAWFAIGLLGAARAAVVGRTALAVAGAASLWCAAVVTAQAMCLYMVARHPSSRLWDRAMSMVAPLQVLEIVSILLVVWVVIAVAERRAVPALREEAFGRTLGIRFLLIVAAAIRLWTARDAYDGSHFVAWTLVASACSLAVFALTARLCSGAADALDAEQPLPTARVVESP